MSKLASFEFPHIKKSVDDFLYDEEGNIPINSVMTIGTVLLVLGFLLPDDASAAHSSHRSHSSHSSHSSGGGGYGHSSHESHSSHVSSYGGDGVDYSGGGGGSTSTSPSHSNTAASTKSVPAKPVHSNVAPDTGTMSQMMKVGGADNINISVTGTAVKPAADLPATTGLDVAK